MAPGWARVVLRLNEWRLGPCCVLVNGRGCPLNLACPLEKESACEPNDTPGSPCPHLHRILCGEHEWDFVSPQLGPVASAGLELGPTGWEACRLSPSTDLVGPGLAGNLENSLNSHSRAYSPWDHLCSLGQGASLSTLSAALTADPAYTGSWGGPNGMAEELLGSLRDASGPTLYYLMDSETRL